MTNTTKISKARTGAIEYCLDIGMLYSINEYFILDPDAKLTRMIEDEAQMDSKISVNALTKIGSVFLEGIITGYRSKCDQGRNIMGKQAHMIFEDEAEPYDPPNTSAARYYWEAYTGKKQVQDVTEEQVRPVFELLLGTDDRPIFNE